MEIAEGPVVGGDLEAVVGSLEGPPRTVPAVGPLADIGAQEGRAIVGAQRAHPSEQLALRGGRVGEADGGEHLVLALGVEVDQGDLDVVLGAGR